MTDQERLQKLQQMQQLVQELLVDAYERGPQSRCNGILESPAPYGVEPAHEATAVAGLVPCGSYRREDDDSD